MTTTRNETIAYIRKRVRGIGVVKGVWRLSLAELRQHAKRLLADRQDWLAPFEKRMLAEFVAEDSE